MPYLYTQTEVFTESGVYSMGPSRLLRLNDSSFLTRIDLSRFYGKLLFSNANYLLWGVPQELLDRIIHMQSNVAHNSYIFKALQVGVVVTLIIIISGFIILPGEVMIVILLYSLSLHALLSPALFLLLSFYFNKKPVKRIQNNN